MNDMILTMKTFTI